MQDVVAAAVTQQVHEHAQPEDERWQDPPPAVIGVQRHARAGGDDAHALVDLRALAPLPLAQRQVGDLVPLGRQALGEIAIPALGAPDRMGEQAVVYKAHAHAASIPSHWRGHAACATFRPLRRYKRNASASTFRIGLAATFSR